MCVPIDKNSSGEKDLEGSEWEQLAASGVRLSSAEMEAQGVLGRSWDGAVGVGCDCGGRNVEAGMLWCLSNVASDPSEARVV